MSESDGISGSSLLGGILLLVAIVGALVGLYVLLPVGGLTVGSITSTAVGDFNGTAGGGAVNVSTAMKTALVGYETSYITDTNAVTANTNVIIGLVAIVVIIIVFGLRNFISNLFRGFGGGGNKGVL